MPKATKTLSEEETAAAAAAAHRKKCAHSSPGLNEDESKETMKRTGADEYMRYKDA